MFRRWFKKPNLVIYLPLILVWVAAVACQTAAPPTEAPTATTAPTPTTAAVEPTAVPTTEAQATQPPGDRTMASPQFVPPFAEYWKPPTDFYGQPVRGGTLRWIYEDPLEHANAWGASAGPADRMRILTANHIVSENPYQDGEVIPDLAEGWTQKDDATGITFFFHDNITWHKGEAFTCEDARFTIETWLTGNGITASAQKSNLDFVDLDTTRCLDNLTLEVGFKGPSAMALLGFAKSEAVIFNKAWFQAGGEDAMFQDISQGTGPFKWEPGQRVGVDVQRFERNPNYFKGDGALPYLDNLVFVAIADESAQQAAMLAHQGDFHWVRNWGQYNAYVDHDQIMTVVRPTRGHLHFHTNPRKEPFDNVRVRQAIFMAIDRAAAIQILQEGHGSTGFIMPPGGAWELDEALGCEVPGWCVTDDMESRRAEARQILEEEGFDFNKTYLFTVESDAQVVSRATFIQEQLRLIGIKTDFDLVENIAYDNLLIDGTWGDLNPGNATMPQDDPFLGMGLYFSSKAVSTNLWQPGAPASIQPLQQQVDDLLAQLAATVDPVERKALSDELQLLLMKSYWRLPVYWEQEAVAFWPEVRGYFHHPQPSGAHTRFEQVWIDPAHKDDKGFKGQTTGVPGGI
jgi:peptide/nickel transport system substrate-binding protein